MIRNAKEYANAVARVEAERVRLDEQSKRLESEGLDREGIERVMNPMRCFHLQLCDEITEYEQWKRGDMRELDNLHGLGRSLIGLRVARGISQKELAERLGTHVSQVSRDERNEYHGITVERAARVLDALGAGLRCRFGRAKQKSRVK